MRNESDANRRVCCVSSQKIFLKSCNSDQRHHDEGGSVRTEESGLVGMITMEVNAGRENIQSGGGRW